MFMQSSKSSCLSCVTFVRPFLAFASFNTFNCVGKSHCTFVFVKVNNPTQGHEQHIPNDTFVNNRDNEVLCGSSLLVCIDQTEACNDFLILDKTIIQLQTKLVIPIGGVQKKVARLSQWKTNLQLSFFHPECQGRQSCHGETRFAKR